MPKRIIIGKKDVVDFPKINLFDIPVKIDSGAYTSSIHCYKMKEILVDGKEKLECHFLSQKDKNHEDGIILFDEFNERKVKSSNGLSEIRYSIKTKIKLFNEFYNIELTLSKRSSMRYRVLLGRKFLNNKFIIDTTKTNLSQKNIIQHFNFETK
ncbi:MAG: RimK/LysX family protein [Vicingaceae bacterium]|nr:RimK/LysX family protein [Vicingaceae bacterium]